MARDPVLTFTERGIFCPAGGFYIDPHRPVDMALITHGHSDHARSGHRAYLATDAALPVIRHRLGRIAAQGIGWGESLRIGAATVSFHPAGHVPGSAQIRVEVAGEVWVVTGDYKTEDDGLSEPFAPVACHSFVTECTFGLPIFRWQPQAVVMAEILGWWQANAAAGRASVIAAYSFGKAQRLMAGLAAAGLAGLPGPILTHPVVEAVTEILRSQGYGLPPTRMIDSAVPAERTRALVIAPPGAGGLAALPDPAHANASGWMAIGATRRSRSGGGVGFVLSDHADWDGLNATIRATGAERVFAMHGYTAAFSRWQRDCGLQAGVVTHHPLQSESGGEGGA